MGSGGSWSHLCSLSVDTRREVWAQVQAVLLFCFRVGCGLILASFAQQPEKGREEGRGTTSAGKREFGNMIPRSSPVRSLEALGSHLVVYTRTAPEQNVKARGMLKKE